ncbi:MAG: YciI family protein [Firmicutes bacterium]|nr:YciI family protein [Bacillota bacterium]
MLFAVWLTVVDKEKHQQSRPDHLRYLNEWQSQGKIFAAGPFADAQGGLVIYQVDSLQEGRRLAENDPAVTSGARSWIGKEWNILSFN